MFLQHLDKTLPQQKTVDQVTIFIDVSTQSLHKVHIPLCFDIGERCGGGVGIEVSRSFLVQPAGPHHSHRHVVAGVAPPPHRGLDQGGHGAEPSPLVPCPPCARLSLPLAQTNMQAQTWIILPRIFKLLPPPASLNVIFVKMAVMPIDYGHTTESYSQRYDMHLRVVPLLQQSFAGL